MLLNKVVIAEDDDAIQHMLGAFLGDAGFLCLRAVNGRDALRLCRTQQPDLLVLDVMMPEMDGFEVTTRLKADPLTAGIPILMLTSLSSVEDRVRGLEAGADDYLPKPFDVRELVARVRALVRARRAARERDPATDLPSGMALEGHVEERLGRGEPFALLRLDLGGFEAFADRFGFRAADDALGQIARAMSDVVAPVAGTFLAHVGGNDFVLACASADAEALARDVIASFEGLRDVLAPDGAGDPPRLTLQASGVDTARLQAESAEDLSRALAEAGRTGEGSPIRWAKAR